jgi:putative nucleotidyltransferase with HDIG domain
MRDRFYNLMDAIVERNGILNLENYLKTTDYFEAPGSSQYHCSKEGGLLEHSINVTELMLKLNDLPEFRVADVESIIICGLFHDLGKSTYFKKPNYLPNILKSGEISKAKPYEHNADRLNIPHQVASIHILSQYIYLTEEETFAILYHNGLYTPDGRAIQGHETKLMLLLHFADMWASRFMEVD